MQKKQLIQLLGIVAVLLLLWWLWPISEAESAQAPSPPSDMGEQELVSAIQPIPNQSAVSLESGFTGELDQQDAMTASDAQISSRFQEAQTLASQGNHNAAIKILESLIDNHPKQVEPYINLASLLVEQGQFDQARKTLTQGLNANATYATLFSNLQKINGSLAVKAYRLAIDEDEKPPPSIELQAITKLNLSANNQQKIAQVLQQIESVGNQLDIANTELASRDKLLSDKNEELKRVNTQLTQTQQQLQTQEVARMQSSENSQVANATLQQELDLIKLQIKNLQRAHQSEVAKLSQQIDEQELFAANLKADTPQQLNQTEQQPKQDSVEQLAQNVADLAEKDQAVVIGLVKAWAKAWSAQQVDRYIAHYTSDYVPPESRLNHSQWVEQRELRLRNKSFIEVSVSEFGLELINGQYSVVFSQHYRSNTMDDVIRKQLKFTADEADWSQSKISSERVMR